VARAGIWAVFAAVLAGVTISVLRAGGPVSLAGPSVGAEVLEVAAGVALILAGGIAGHHRNRWLLPAAGACWLVAEWANPAGPGAVAFTAGLVTVMTSLPLVLAGRWRRVPETSTSLASGAAGARVSRVLPLLLGLAVLLATAGAMAGGVVAAIAASPSDAGCTDCPRDLIALAHDTGLSAAMTTLGARLSVAVAVVAAAWLAMQVVAAARRRGLSALRAELAADAAAVAFALASAGGAIVVIAGGPGDPASYGWRSVADICLLGLAAAVARPALRAAHAMRLVARAAIMMADDQVGGAATALGAALNDADLRVAYPMADGTWRDHRGQSVTLPGQNMTVVTDAGENIAALIHGSAVHIDNAAVTGAVSAARILLDAERLDAGARARVDDLRSARTLVVDSADVARARLERDLHDGAQQRLVALRYALGLARAHAAREPSAALAARLDGADAAAERALAELRELAHGISTATLGVEGLAGAVRSVAEQAHGRVTITELPAERVPGTVERAAFRFVTDMVREADRMPGPGMSIAVRRCADEVVVQLEYEDAMPTQDWPSAHVTDRVAAAGGLLRRTDGDNGCQLIVVLPCE
jgi:signal transduction histidine kinase